MKSITTINLRWFLIFVIVLSGCVATAPKYITTPKATGEEATVYVYRPRKFAMLQRTPTVEVEDVAAFGLPSGGYTVLSLPAGRHRFLIDWLFWSSINDVNREFRFEASKNYYIKYDVVLSSMWFTTVNDVTVLNMGFSNDLVLVDDTTGTTEIEDCKLVE